MSLEVKKTIPVTVDLGNLAVFDINILENDISNMQSSEEKEQYLMQLCRDNVQLLINDLFDQPTRSSDVGPIVTLPTPVTALPRAKPVPKAKEPTRWEQFARAKGIVKRKRSAHVYDEDVQDWRPRFGYKSKKNDPMNNWMTELKPGQDINELN